MLNEDDFRDYPNLNPIIEKLNKLISKNRIQKIPKVINELYELLSDETYIIPVSYALSMIAEKKIDFILDHPKLVEKIDSLLNSNNIRLKINSIIILGFCMLATKENIKKYAFKFAELLLEESKDVKENAYYFLQEIDKKEPSLLCSHKDIFVKALNFEKKNMKNLLSLVSFLENCKEFNFEQLYELRKISKNLISTYCNQSDSELYSKLTSLVIKNFPKLTKIDFKSCLLEDLEKIIKKQFIMKRYNFNDISEKKKIELKEFLRGFKESRLIEKKIYFYTKNKKQNLTFVYELEKKKLIQFFSVEKKISNQKILEEFSQILKNGDEVKLFVKILIKLGYIRGFYSELGFFYSYNHVKSEILNNLRTYGEVDLKNYDYLPEKYVMKVIENIVSTTKEEYVLSKDKTKYFSLNKIQETIQKEAAKNTTINLLPYRERLTEEHFIRLIKNLPKKYLTNIRKGPYCLTNIGKTKILNELENSKIYGFFDLKKISDKLNINIILLNDVLEVYLDLHSGIWDKNKEVFIYSKYIKEKIDKINLIKDNNEKNKQIDNLANMLNIGKDQILIKIDENLRLIGEEIKQKDIIKIREYLEKTGMNYNAFIDFIEINLGLNYFKRGDTLLFKPAKIEKAKIEIKSMLIEKSKSNDFISLGTFDIATNLVKDLINELKRDENLTGILYEDEHDIIFYTEHGICNLMLEYGSIFSLHDLFYGKELSREEIEVLMAVFKKLVMEEKLKGNFDEETLTFSGEEVVFANDYNIVLDTFEKTINKYIEIFNSEFQKIKKILTKREETIFPQEIKKIQEIIDRINENYGIWRINLESFVRKANIEFLKKQGLSVKKYRSLSLTPEKMGDIKSFEEDPEVIDLLNGFNAWVKLFNELELKFPNVIFYQKRSLNNPNDSESKEKLKNLLESLHLI